MSLEKLKKAVEVAKNIKEQDTFNIKGGKPGDSIILDLSGEIILKIGDEDILIPGRLLKAVADAFKKAAR